MLTDDSTGKDWREASPEMRHDYAGDVCRIYAESESGVKPPSAHLVQEGISKYYNYFEKFHHTLEDASSESDEAINRYGHYGPLAKHWR